MFRIKFTIFFLTFHPMTQQPFVQSSSKSFLKTVSKICFRKKRFTYLRNNSNLVYPRLTLTIPFDLCFGIWQLYRTCSVSPV